MGPFLSKCRKRNTTVADDLLDCLALLVYQLAKPVLLPTAQVITQLSSYTLRLAIN
jgi:hypothetical protein